MSEVLERIARRFSDRISVHRRMLAHLDIAVPPEAAQEVMGDLRTTLLSCTRCAEPELCATWAANDFPGLPSWCSARAAFDRLARETGAPPPGGFGA